MKPRSKELKRLYSCLLKRFGHQNWWPAHSRGAEAREFEIFVGAILTQQTAWTQVEKAITKLREAKLINPKRLAEAEARKISKLIRPVSFYPTKARRLKELAGRWSEVKGIAELPIDDARREMLKLKGIGPETCDSILLYAFHRPTFVVDAYTRRLVERCFGIHAPNGRKGYEKIKGIFESSLPRDHRLFNEYHALIVELGKNQCRTKPKCIECPLKKCAGIKTRAMSEKCS